MEENQYITKYTSSFNILSLKSQLFLYFYIFLFIMTSVGGAYDILAAPILL